MLVTINGKESEISDNSSVRDLIQDRTLPENIVIIELNGEIIKRERWGSLKLNSHDKVEIIRIIGGG